MKLILRDAVLDENLSLSNVAEPAASDPAEYNSATGYTIGQKSSSITGANTASITHGIYESTFDGINTDNDPTIQGASKAFWKFTGSSLRWAMYNDILQDKTRKLVQRASGLTLNGSSGNFASSPDIAAFPLGKVVIIIKATANDWTPSSPEALFSKYTEAGDQRSLKVFIDSLGRIGLSVSPDGSSVLGYLSESVTGILDASAGWIRIDFDGDNGSASSATFYSSSSDTDNYTAVAWNQLGAEDTDAQTSIFNSSAVLELGSSNAGAGENFSGSVQEVLIFDGLIEYERVLVADYNRIDPVAGSTSTSHRTGLVWTDQSSAVFSQDVPGIITDLSMAGIISAMAAMRVSGTEVQIIGSDSAEGEIFNQSFSLLSFLGIDSIWNWLFRPIGRDSNAVSFSMPSYRGLDIRVIIRGAEGETVECGALIVGQEFLLGTSVYGAGYGINNYSQKEEDKVSGSVTITSGPFKSQGDIDVVVEPEAFTLALNTLTGIRDTPTVWVAEEGTSGTIQYGYYTSFALLYEDPAKVVCQLSIEGLG